MSTVILGRSRRRHTRAVHAEAPRAPARRRRRTTTTSRTGRSKEGSRCSGSSCALSLIAGTVGCAARSGTHAASVRSGGRMRRDRRSDSLAVFMDKVRAKSEQARPASNRGADRRGLGSRARGGAARRLDAADRRQSSRGRRRYVRLGILDQAHEHFSARGRARSDGCGVVGRARAHLARLGISPPGAVRCVPRRLLRARLAGCAQHTGHGAAGARPTRRRASAVRTGARARRRPRPTR